MLILIKYMKFLKNLFKRQKGNALSLSKGFTLIELLVVIGILAILLAITLIAINPARQFAQANNTQRQSDVNAILNAIHQYMADNNGVPPAGITNVVATVATDDGAGAAEADICSDLVTTYMADLPLDPQDGTEAPANSVCSDALATYNTAYTVVASATDNRITVTAPGAELSAQISVTR